MTREAPKLGQWQFSGFLGWKIVAPDWYDTILTHKNGLGELEEALAPYIKATANNHLSDFKLALTLQGVALLVGFFTETKTVRLYSPYAQEEQLWLSCLGLDSKKTPLAIEFEAHIQAIMALEDLNQPSDTELRNLCWQELPGYRLPEPSKDNELLIEKTNSLVAEMLPLIGSYHPSLLERFSDFGLDWVARRALLRVHLLKFIVLVPVLDYPGGAKRLKLAVLEAIRRTLNDSVKAKKAYRTGQQAALPGWMTLLLGLTQAVIQVLPSGLVKALIDLKLKFVASRFIAGESLKGILPTLKALQQSHRGMTLDPLGELVVSPQEADAYQQRVLDLIDQLAALGLGHQTNAAGLFEAHVSIKTSALAHDFKPLAPDYSYLQVAPRLKRILLAAKQAGIFINLDAEHYSYRDLTLTLYSKLLLETPELADYSQTGIVLQAYLQDALPHLLEMIELAKKRGVCLPIRLVKGAYWDAETVEAEAHGHKAPQLLNKAETDIQFRQLAEVILAHWPHVQLAVASHNLADHAYIETLQEAFYPLHPAIEHQCLHMTYEGLSVAMAKQGWVVRNYVPIGPLLVGMAYLVRRILENASQVGVLMQSRSHKQLKQPVEPNRLLETQKQKGLLSIDPILRLDNKGFKGLPPTQLFLPEEKLTVESALSTLNQALPLSVDTESPLNGDLLASYNPSKPSQYLGSLKQATKEDVHQAVLLAEKAFLESEGWSAGPAEHRSACLIRAASQLRLERADWAALICLEAGKTPVEALADVDEAVDFLVFYAKNALSLAKSQAPQAFAPRGPTAVIAPWNFPLAIAAGMTAGPLVMGNPVLLKPAEQTPLVAQRFVTLLHKAGVPLNALACLPGPGETIGAALANHPKVAGIVFTGSKKVGLRLLKEAGSRLYNNPVTQKAYPVKVITEMGGKNTVLVSQTADLDEAVTGILQSAFGHAGQKCSAASRVLVEAPVAQALLKRLTEAAKALPVGDSSDWNTRINPLILQEEQARVRKTVAAAAAEAQNCGGTLWLNRSTEEQAGNTVGPVIIEVPASHFLSLTWPQEEVFGPVLHVCAVSSLQEGLKLANQSQYGLTAGLFSQSQDEIDEFLAQMQAGNLYINRTITGARVGIEPFGGFKLSGTGPKAGGESYLHAFICRFSTPAMLLEEKNLKNPDFTRQPVPSPIPGQASFIEQTLKPQRVVEIKEQSLENCGFDWPEARLLLQMAQKTGIPTQIIALGALNAFLTELETVFPEKPPEKPVVFLLNGQAAFQQEALETLLQSLVFKHWLPKIITPDCFFPTEEACYEALSYPRAVAINLMRHGAPLVLED